MTLLIMAGTFLVIAILGVGMIDFFFTGRWFKHRAKKKPR